MRIISKFRDYYDAAQSHGRDDSVTFVRHATVIAGQDILKAPPEVSFLRDFLANRMPREIDTSSRNCWSIFVTHGIVLFAGKLHPFGEIMVQHRDPKVAPATEFVYSHAALESSMARLGQPMTSKDSMVRGGFQESATRTAFFDLAGSSALMGSAISHRVPILLHRVRPALFELNPRLAGIDFVKQLDVWQAHQELAMFIGNLAAPGPATVTLTEVDRSRKHGFDKWSFRKMPES